MFNELLSVKLANGETITYRESGNDHKDLVLLIHGNMTSSFHYNTLFQALEKDYHVIAPDMRGFGGSSYHKPIDALRDFADDISELMDVLKLKRAVTLGWSTGGGVAMEMAIHRPDLVKKLILVESVGIMGYPMFRKDENGQPIIGDFISSREDIAADPTQVLPVLEAIRTKNKETYRAIWNAVIYTHNQPEPDMYEAYLDDMLTQRNLVDVDYALVHFNLTSEHNGVVIGTKEITKITCPVLIFQGERDMVVPKSFGDGIYEALKDLSTYVTGDWGHSPFVDCPEFMVEEIQKFIEE